MTTTSLDRVRAAFGAARGGDVKCPAHEDHNASLSIGAGRNGGVVVKCHAGCDVEDVVGAAGLTMLDLAPEQQPRPPTRRQVAAYPYLDESGVLLYEVMRFHPKDFRQRRPDGNGGWLWNMGRTRRLLYRLPELLAGVAEGRRVFVAEGEKDCDALVRAGEVATCGPMGAGKWSQVAELAQHVLAGAEVIVIADKDTPGRKHAAEVVAALDPVAASVVVVEAATGKDAADHLGAGRPVDELRVVDPEDTVEGDVTPGGLLPMAIEWGSFWAKDRTAEDWLLEPFLPNGRMTAVWADRKAGKSLLALEVAAALATGRPILDRPRSAPIHVAYFDLEMTEDDLYERLQDMGYGPDNDLSCLHYYLLPSLPPLDTAEGGDAVEAIVVRDHAQVVVIDTMARVVKGEENESTTYRAFYQHTGLRLKMRGITGLRLDHSGKDPTKGARGSSAKGDDIDLGWELKVADDGAVVLTRKLTRISWVPDRVNLRRLDDPLRHVVAAGAVWPAGTKDTADDLDRLAVATNATYATALATLKEHDLGRRKNVILAALKWRRQLLEDAIERSGTAPGTALPTATPEPPREPESQNP